MSRSNTRPGPQPHHPPRSRQSLRDVAVRDAGGVPAGWGTGRRVAGACGRTGAPRMRTCRGAGVRSALRPGRRDESRRSPSTLRRRPPRVHARDPRVGTRSKSVRASGEELSSLRQHEEGGALLSLSEQSEGGPRDAISRWSNGLWLHRRVGRDNKICLYFSESFKS
jgi:hypothetical protein